MKSKVLFPLLMLAAVAGLSSRLQAQTGLYTITNGTLKWVEVRGAGDSVRTDIGYHNGLPRYQTNGSNVTYDLQKGTTYLALDLSGSEPNFRAVSSFSEYCVWKSSGDVGYYWQEWDGYRYYLAGSIEEPMIYKVAMVGMLNSATYWYKWNYGAGIDKSYVRAGDYHVSRYWLMYDGATWRMSCESQERPETINWPSADPAVTNKEWFCSNSAMSGYAGTGAVVMPVTLTEEPASIHRPGGVNVGLKDVNLSATTISYISNEPIVATPEYFPTAAGTYQYTPAYRIYTEETRRLGINLTESSRTTDTYGAAGVPTTRNIYYWEDGSTTRSGSNPPSSSSINISPSDVRKLDFTLSNNAKRYLSVVVDTPTNPRATITCIAAPEVATTVSITLTVTTSQGISESVTKEFTILPDVNRDIKTTNEKSVFVSGYVFGGGRMADVEGNTDVVVNNCDTISMVFGGNDIGGRVTGGSNVLIGTDLTTAEKPIGIGSVYGAGNGYYHYPSRSTGVGQPIGECFQYIAAANISTWNNSDVVAENSASDLFVPTIRNTVVTVNSRYAVIDSLFGGARNANVGYTDVVADTATSVRINDGIIFAVFGGNNVGGCLQTGKPTGLYVTGDYDEPGKNAPVPILNSFYTNYGRDFGIRYVFGGGNKVFHNGDITMVITGGMIDSVFAGGNSADVKSTFCEVNCDGSNTIYYNHTVATLPASFDPASHQPEKWVGARGRYNVRALFGGNNMADMNTIPDLKLEAGGIGAVYGGGNQGDMVYDDPTYATLRQNIRDSINVSLAKFTGDATTYIKAPVEGVSTYVHLVPSDHDKLFIDYVYGGCRSANVLTSTLVDMEGGKVGAVFGGCNISGDVGSTISAHGRGMAGTYVHISGGDVLNNVYAGANGYYHCAEGERLSAAKYVAGVDFTDNEGTPFDAFDDYIGYYRPTHNYTHLLISQTSDKVDHTIIYGNVYGGGNHAAVGFYTNNLRRPGKTAAEPCEALGGGIHFAINGGTVKGNVFGGANMAQVYGLSYVHALGDAVIEGALYGGNDRLGNVLSDRPFYSILHDNSFDMQASDGTLLNASATNTPGNTSVYSTYVKVEGTPTINMVYGGGNGAYNYDGTRPEYPEIDSYCESDGTPNLPEQYSTFIDVNTSGGNINYLFGGGNAVGVVNKVNVLINSEPGFTAVDTIFGGNNQANMETCVPHVDLKRGQVNTVYGGSNVGHMKAFTSDITDACGEVVKGVSSYVLVNSDDITVLGAIYGGCNKADVLGKAFVDIRKTSDHGVDTVYGGNDVSGIVRGNTRVDISGGIVGTIYGGSNGYYDYVQVDHNNYAVYRYGSDVSNPDNLLYDNSIGSPVVHVTRVNVFGGKTANNVYGGGRMGDCNVTNVIINDQACGDGGAIIRGYVYGGGEGDTTRLDKVHRGNVLDSTHVELHHAKDVIAVAYGGGKGGDVVNTNIYSYDTWDQSFNKIYGGCWGADVKGVAHLDLRANEAKLNSDKSIYTAEMVFGGNDFSGNVYSTNMVIHSGRYGNVYGGGNGDFESNLYSTSYVADAVNNTGYTRAYDLKVPNSEYIKATINGGEFNGTVYGGGRLGTTFSYLKDDNNVYYEKPHSIDLHPQKIADTNFTAAYLGPAATGLTQSLAHAVYTDPLKYSYIILNVHDGLFNEDIFTGAMGRDNQLIYGVKVLNMDGGLVKQSIYGGSQSVSDGYSRSECVDSENTSLRPSSILNVTGGTVTSHAYGAGYKGYTYGSVYFNAGLEAVNNAVVYDTIYNGNRAAYKVFQPGTENSLSDNLVNSNDLFFEGSIYAGANWGQNDGSYIFNAPGFFGGETRILIDGEGYATSSAATGSTMAINNSVFGSGTSVLGGDRLSRIDIRNYGQEENCDASKVLMSVQRADTLFLHNTAIAYEGTADASTAFHSQTYSFKNVTSVNAIGYNIIHIKSPVENIEELFFYEDAPYSDYDHNRDRLVLADVEDLTEGLTACDEMTAPMCTKLGNINPNNRKYTALIASTGVTVDVESNGITIEYGSVQGYAYLFAQEGTRPIIMARMKTTTVNPNDGGFSAGCSTGNVTINGSTELEYHNYAAKGYRYWAPGVGVTRKDVVILAHSDLNAIIDTNHAILVGGSTTETASEDRKLSVAHTVFSLPPASSAGSYYVLSKEDGVVINEANSPMELIDVAWNPTSWDGITGDRDKWTARQTAGAGSWYIPVASDGASSDNFSRETNITANPNSTFALMLAPKSGFSSGGYQGTGRTIISPSGHIKVSSNNANDQSEIYTTPGAQAQNLAPEMEFFLTYDNSFFNAILSSVKFTLLEYNSNGTPTGNSVNVEVYISTIINELRDMEYTLIAKYNGGVSNHFVRRTLLPATLKTQDLYVNKIVWNPTKASENLPPSTPIDAHSDTVKFHLTNDTTYILNDVSEGFRYAVAMKPVENNATDNLSAIGWNSIRSQSTDLYSLGYADSSHRSFSIRVPDDNGLVADSIVLAEPKLIGILDGRGMAGLNFDLTYNGSYEYDCRGCYVGDIVLSMESRPTGTTGVANNKFKITLHVQVFPGGDTIYVASAPTITRAGKTLSAYGGGSFSLNENMGLRPKFYVRTFSEAMAIRKNGDVICILDEVTIPRGVDPVNIEGASGDTIQIIRYEGHHSDMPGEDGVYRGTMITVDGVNGSGAASFSTRFVDFRGSLTAFNWNESTLDTRIGVSETKPLLSLDTNVVYGPIIAVKGSAATVTLGDNTIVEENFNMSTDDATKGTINVSDNGTLLLTNAVVRNNLSAPNKTKDLDNHYYRNNGAVYSNDGIIRASGIVTVTDNYLYRWSTPPTTGYDTVFWRIIKSPAAIAGDSVTYTIGLIPGIFDKLNLPKANVFLTRTPSSGSVATDNMITDDKTNIVDVRANAIPAAGSKIGISKWFPGEQVRDTIRIVYANNPTNARVPWENDIYLSDEGYNVLYSTGIQNRTVYFTRCATFQHQVYSRADEDKIPNSNYNVYPDSTMRFRPDPNASCPTPTDQLIYSVQGGFFPYTYKWYDAGNNSIATTQRPSNRTNTQVWNQVRTGNTTLYNNSVHDTLRLPAADMPMGSIEAQAKYRVEATDVMGCKVAMDVTINYEKDRSVSELYTLEAPTANWNTKDTGLVATAKRYYRGVQITAKAWPERSGNSISALVKTVDELESSGGVRYVHIEGDRLSDKLFCEGDIINLSAKDTVDVECGKSYFVMWDFNPYMPVNYTQHNYVVPANDAEVVAYYAPNKYWAGLAGPGQIATDVYNANDFAGYYYGANTNDRGTANYVTTYNGDVHIYNKMGLAWFISVVNGLNGTTAREFYFNKVYVHQPASVDDDYDMSCYLWTPVGTPQHPFRGWFQGVSSNPYDTTALPEGQQVVIKNIIVNEPNMTSAGFFGYMDTARVRAIKFEGAMIRGSQYVGTLAGHSTHAKVKNVVVADYEENSSTTILTTHNISGGLIGKSTSDNIKGCKVETKFVGDAVYSGGVVGYAKDTVKITNTENHNTSRLAGLYVGGIAGYADGTAPLSQGLFRSKSAGAPVYIANNYVRFTTNGMSMRAGGLVGYAQNAIIENNYVYGSVTGTGSEGGVGAMMATNTVAHNNYYAKNDAKQAVGMQIGNASLEDNTSFEGSGNSVTLTDNVYGVNNLTRVLNIWVREQNAQGGDFLTWRSDLDGDNNGYPLFGEPDLIPVRSQIVIDGCEEVEHDGVIYTEDAELTFNVIDSVQMIDSTMSTLIRIHRGTTTTLADTATLGEDYEAYGFYVSAAESALLQRSLDSAGRATIVLTDTLQTEFGCDSVVTLTVTFSAVGIVDVKPVAQVKVFPNPTLDQVNVAADEMTRVEVYDNEGRRLQNNETYGNQQVTLSLGRYPAGIYYIRVHASTGVTIQKVIKR